MTFLLLRVIKRKASLEKSADEFYELELRRKDGLPDLDLSVYLIPNERPRIVQTICEHWAGVKDPPQDPVCRALETTGAHGTAPVEPKPARGPFEFTRSSHHEIRFMRETEMRNFAVCLLEQRTSRAREVPKEDVRRYAGGRFASRDPEWEQLGSVKPKWKKWSLKEPSANAVALNAPLGSDDGE